MTELTSFKPDWVSPPSSTIEDLLEENGWTKAEFAERLGATRKHVNDLVHDRTRISPSNAGRLSRVLGSTPEFWLVRDAQYCARLERQRSVAAAANEAEWLKELPLPWMRKQGWLHVVGDKGKQVLEALEFFGVASVEAWKAQYAEPLAAFRSSTKFQKKAGPVAVWLRQAERQARELQTRTFVQSEFKARLKALRVLTKTREPRAFLPELVQSCAEVGVAVVLVPAPTGCPASGATQWLTPEKAMIALSLRHKTNDHFWFTFFHEAGHLVLHSKKMLFIDGLGGLDEELEDAANRFASDLLIPPDAARELELVAGSGVGKLAKVIEFSQRVGVAPGIVVGRMQKEGWIGWNQLNKLKVRYEWSTTSS